MTIDNSQLYKSLSEMGVIDKEQLDDTFEDAKETGEALPELLLQRDLISDENLGMLTADLLKVPFISLNKVSLNKEVLKTLSEEMARAKGIVIFKIDKEGTHVAMSDPKDLVSLSFLKKVIKGSIKIYYATNRDIRQALFAYREDVKRVFEEIINKNVSEIKEGETEAPIIELVETIMTYAYQSRASDVHIEPTEEATQLRFRVDGVLHDVIMLPKRIEDQLVSRVKILSSLPTDEHLMALDGKFDFEVPDMERIDVRVSIVPSTHGERVVMRILAGDIRRFALLDLGISEKDIEKVRKAYSKPFGMVLATGPTGSGKTTTLYSFLKILNKRNINIMTIEDPVEYQIQGVNQIQVNQKTNLTFAAGLKSIVRQDPNVILVGEIRDEDTASIAVNAAMTGHLVLSTLHTSDAATTIPRLLEMKVEPFLIASSVSLIVGQRLVRKVCTSCRMSVFDDEMKAAIDELPKDLIKKHLGKINVDTRLYRGKGCPVCQNTGYTGRVGIFEMIPMTPAIKEAIMNKADAGEIKKIAIKEGMTTMVEDGLEKMKMGITTPEELLRVIKE
ncbi:MAG TPA: GspE/PulE family protein [Candidatus Woesebacteria bacterium]|nr:GspE/PulE family protein [Candidatus Woesebacteria bacterium]